eukprot:767096-Hanusia_phi.AAC.4
MLLARTIPHSHLIPFSILLLRSHSLVSPAMLSSLRPGSVCLPFRFLLLAFTGHRQNKSCHTLIPTQPNGRKMHPPARRRALGPYPGGGPRPSPRLTV